MPTSSLTSPRPPAPTTGRRSLPVPRLDERFLPLVGGVLILVVMLAVGGSRYENFLSPLVMSNLLIDNSYIVILAVGATVVILTGGIDLSVGAVVALSGVLGARLFAAGYPSPLVMPAMVVIGTLFGLLIGIMVLVFEVQPFIASLAAMFLARGLCFVIAPNSIPIRNETVATLGTTRFEFGEWVITPSGLIALATLAVAFVVLHHTRFGRTVYAIGADNASAKLMGLPVRATTLAVYLLSGTCSGIAGLVFAVSTRAGYSRNGIGMELTAIAAVVVGGTVLTGGRGFVLGSLLGVLALGLIQTMITFEGTLSAWWTSIAIGSLVLVLVVVQRLVAIRRT